MTEVKKADVGYVFSFAANLANGAALTINGNFPVQATAGEMAAELDKIKGVFDRQRAKDEVPMLTAQLEALERQAEQVQADLEQYLGSHGDKAQDKTHVARVKAQLKNTVEDVIKGKLALEATKLRAV